MTTLQLSSGCTLLTETATSLKADYPAYRKTIAQGLAYALLGKVKPWNFETGKPATDTFSMTYRVGQYKVEATNPTSGWLCNCPQGFSYGPKVQGLFVGQECLHLCKHICAAAICWLADTYPSTPLTVLEAFKLFVEAGEVPALKESVKITSQASLYRREQDGRQVLILKAGHLTSKPLCHWGTEMGQQNQGVWLFEQDLEQRYNEFNNKVSGSSR
jgi:hypothetical protein